MRQFSNATGLLIATVVVLGVTVAFNEGYRSDPLYNASLFLRDTALLGVFALGAAVVIISGGIDLSAGAVIAFSGSVCSATLLFLAPLDSRGDPDFSQLTTVDISLGIAATLAAGFMIGTLHTWLITVIRLPPFVATLASLVGLRSLAKLLNKQVNSGSIKINVNNTAFEALGDVWWIPLLLFLTLGAALWFLLTKTVAGRHLYAMGGNERAATLSGIRTERLKWLAYCISAMTAALAGVLYTSKIGSSDPETQGMGYELNAIAAAVVGGCSLQGGIGQIPAVMLGVLFLRAVIDAVPKLVGSGADDYQGIIVGFLVVLAVAFNELRQNEGKTRKQLFPAALGSVSLFALAMLGGLTAYVIGGKQAGAWTLGLVLTLLVAVKIYDVARSRQLRIAASGPRSKS